MKKIELTESEVAALKKQVAGKFERVFSSDEEKEALSNVIEKASELVEELDAYEEMDGDLMQWYYNKYKEQEGISE